jgi:protein involved in polysaccharide export with SLBB domain
LIAVDYQALVENGDVSQNPELQRGDRILVPERERFYLFGAVVQPGMYPVSKKDFRLAEVIGFMDPAADLSHVRIIRPDPQGAEPVSLQANLTRFMKTADQSQNMVIQPGDFIYVPPKGKKEPWYSRLFQYNTMWSAVTLFDFLDRQNIF